MKKNVVLAAICFGFFTGLGRAQQAVYLVEGANQIGSSVLNLFLCLR